MDQLTLILSNVRFLEMKNSKSYREKSLHVETYLYKTEQHKYKINVM